MTTPSATPRAADAAEDEQVGARRHETGGDGGAARRRPPTPRRLTYQMERLRQRKAEAERATATAAAVAGRAEMGGETEAAAGRRVAFSAAPAQEMVAELSPASIRRGRGAEGPAAAAALGTRAPQVLRLSVAAQASLRAEEEARAAARDGGEGGGEGGQAPALLTALHEACACDDVRKC